MLKKILECIPAVTALILIIGIIKLNLYYSAFNIPINYFMGLSEISSQVSSDLMYSLLTTSATLAILPFLNRKPKVEILVESGDKSHEIKKATSRMIYYAVMVLSNLFLIVWAFFPISFHWRLINSTLIYICFFFTFLEFEHVKKFFADKPDLYLMSLLFISTLGSNIIFAAKEMREVVNGKYNGTKIVTENNTYLSSDTLKYIGQTEKYVFLYTNHNSSVIIPVSQIKEVELHDASKKFNISSY